MSVTATARATVGILGGMGPLATSVFYTALVRETAAERDQDHLPVLIDADPRIHDRTAFLLGDGEDPRPMLVTAAQRLVNAGATIGVMPCNTANVWVAEVSAASGLAIVPWLEVAADAAARYPTVGLLATSGTIRAGIYQRLLAERAVTALVPTEKEQVAVMAAIYAPDGVKAAGRASAARRRALLDVAGALVARGAAALLLGCTELPLAIPSRDPAWPVPVIDPSTEVARRVIALAGGRLREVVPA